MSAASICDVLYDLNVLVIFSRLPPKLLFFVCVQKFRQRRSLFVNIIKMMLFIKRFV